MQLNVIFKKPFYLPYDPFLKRFLIKNPADPPGLSLFLTLSEFRRTENQAHIFVQLRRILHKHCNTKSLLRNYEWLLKCQNNVLLAM